MISSDHNNEAQIVIVCYRPKEGKAETLKQLMREHHVNLKSQDLVTERVPVLMEAKDGTIIEVFEWKSQAAIAAAHSNPVVLKMWGQYAEACDMIPLGKVEEATNLFPGFKPLT
jgi:hypothetical protein